MTLPGRGHHRDWSPPVVVVSLVKREGIVSTINADIIVSAAP